MPNMDGHELYQAIKRDHPDLPILLMTAFHHDKDHEERGSRDTPGDRVEALRPCPILEPARRFESPVCPSGPAPDRRAYDEPDDGGTGDEDQLIQALLNIVRNAVQATEGKGRVLLQTRVLRQFTLANRRYRLVVQVNVEDNGPGIPEELQQAVFYPMVSSKAEGTGLGLSIAQSLINRHGGLIEFTSRPGKTVFTLYLPLELEQ
ncbi:MAG: hypothetical protein DSZ01_02255, partial [Gammaproteobacteria bacterium]